MSVTGAILVLEDDRDDQDILESIFSELKISNTRLYFEDPLSFISYLRETKEQPFIIFSDVNLPMVNGISLKQTINDDELLRSKTIPYIFLTTAANKKDVVTAYHLNAQGFFVKGNSVAFMTSAMESIISYWRLSLHPNNI